MNIRKFIESYDPDVVVWCLWSKDKELEINKIGLSMVLSIIKPTVRFIYVSTDLSQIENQNEESPPEPRSEGMYLANYINGKILGEKLTQSHMNYVIVRPGQIYGFGADGEIDTRMQRIKDEIEKNGKMIRSANTYISIIHVEDLATCIIELINNSFIGILCVASNKIVSFYEFYKFLAKLIGIDESRIIPEFVKIKSNGYFNTSKARLILKTKIRDLC